jgi:ABC-type transport system involved in multi-copper enzyme maturation permease subunit
MYLFWHDLRRLARHGRPALGRVVLGLSLLIVLATVYSIRFPVAELSDLSTTYIHDGRRMSGFGAQLYFVINVVQLVVLVVVTPAVCGGAFAVERVRGTLDLLRISEASSLAIVLGKFAARFVYLGSFLLFCLPLIVALELWSAVDPIVVASSFAIQFLTLAALVALSLACTADAKSPAAGVALTYAVVGLLAAALNLAPWMNPPAIFAAWRLGGAVTYLGSLIAFATLSIPLTVVCLGAAVVQLARDDERPQSGVIPMSGSRAAPPAELDARLLAPIDVRPMAFLYRPLSSYLPQVASVRLFRPPRVADHPMCWKEIYHGGNALAAELLRTVFLGIILIEAIAGAFLIVRVMHYTEVPTRIALQWNSIFQLIVLNSLSVAILSCAALAAASVTFESEQKTLEAILALPHGRPSVLATKWLGSIARVRWPLAATILPLAFGLVIGAFQSSSIAVLVFAVAVQLVFAASLGMCCSVLFSSTTRSMLAAVLVILVSGLLSAGGFYPLIGKLGGASAQHTAETFGYRLSPLTVWQTLLSRPTPTAQNAVIPFALHGIAFYACAAAALAGLAILLFVRKSKA